MSAVLHDGFRVSDSSERVLRLFASLADSVVMSDSGQTTATYSVQCQDGSEFVDNIAGVLRLVAHLSDGLSASDVVFETSILAQGKVSVSFSFKTTTVTFEIEKPGASFDVKKPDVGFNLT
jgi:hypothetical protein